MANYTLRDTFNGCTLSTHRTLANDEYDELQQLLAGPGPVA